MCVKNWVAAVLLVAATSVCAAQNYIVPSTTVTALTVNNTSAANSFRNQTDGNIGAGNVSKLDTRSLLYTGSTAKIYAHLLLWFGASNHMNVGYSSIDPTQIHRQIVDMISRGIDGVIIDWYGPNNSIDQATQLVMAEAELHPGFTFAIMVDQGAIKWDSCTGCNAQQALISQLQYVEQKYFSSPAYMTIEGKPVVTNFDIDLSYTVDWTAAAAALATQPVFLFQNNSGFSHVLSSGSYSWVMPTTTDYGMSYLTSFYDTGIPVSPDETVGAAYKGFNDSLASWGSGRVMGQQCGQTWLQTFSKVNSLYSAGAQLSALQLVTWNDYEEGSEIESGIGNCFSLSAKVSGSALQWTPQGSESTVAHYTTYISNDGQNLMPLDTFAPGTDSLNLCSFPIPNGSYVLYVYAVGKPSMTNLLSAPVNYTSNCSGGSQTGSGNTVSFAASPSSVTIDSNGKGQITINAARQAGAFSSPIALSCTGLPQNLACEFSPASIVPSAKPVSSVLTLSIVSTTANQQRNRRGQPLYAFWLFSLGGAGLVFTGKQQRGRLLRILGACILAVMILVCVSCGGKMNSQTVASQGQTAGTYAVTVNGSTSSIQLATTIAVTVQ